jgi:SAM-dependent methyltransferase
MSAMPPYRLYADLAAWWPLISPPGEYAGEAAYLRAVLAAAPVPARRVLDLGSGGGNVAAHLKAGRALTLVDLSPEMLAVSRELNPECAHQQGDMRTVRLGRAFDAVLVHDAVDYMTTEGDLRQVIETARAHVRPGGLALFVPDYTAETFEAARGHGGSSDPAGRQASFQERTWDPDPGDSWIQSEYEFVLRGADGSVQVVNEAHRLGAFGRDTWLRLLRDAGFDTAAGAALEAGVALEAGAARAGGGAARRPRNLFIGVRPRAAGPGAGRPGGWRWR